MDHESFVINCFRNVPLEYTEMVLKAKISKKVYLF